MSVGIKILGDAIAVIGYSASFRDHVRSLIDAGADVIMPIGQTRYETVELDPWWKENMSKLQEPKPYKFTMSYCAADFYTREDGKYNIGFTPWEITRVAPKYAENMNRMDEIWSTSKFCLDAFAASGVKKPMLAVPWPLNDRWFNHNGKKALTDLGDQFVFFCFGTLDERKNQKDLIAAYLYEFGKEGMREDGTKVEKGCVLALKTFMGSHQPPDVNRTMETLKVIKNNYANSSKLSIKVIIKNIPEDDLPDWMNVADCYVCPSKGEGMGGPAIQCMALGKPLVSTTFSAMQDYHQTPFSVRHVMEPVHGMNFAFGYAGSDGEWGRPDVGDLRVQMRAAYQMWKDKPEEWKALCQKQKDFIRERFNYRTIGKVMKDRLEELNSKLP
jgi:glycosyltransferase involved in cell wall biosynthesis